jgi:hypothetical protein
MQEPDMRIDTLDHFAVELEHQPEHAVRRRMLWAEIYGEFALVALALAAIGFSGACVEL